MKHKHSSSFKTISLILALSLLPMQVVAALGNELAPDGAGAGAAVAVPQPQALGRLTTRGNQAIQVNGNSVKSGATIPTGASIGTGDGVGATINLGPLGVVELAPNTQLTLDYSTGQIKVMLTQGCVIVRARQGTYAEIDTAQGKVASNDPVKKEAATLDTCLPPGATAPIVNQGAAANAGAGAGTGGGAAAAGAGAGPLVDALPAIIIGGAALGIGLPVALSGGANPSGSNP